jgi:RNA polymerase subunit RPABC4/transcription elongation factor Spt4
MRHCLNCGRITAGDPLFCNVCGRSFDKKLCPRLHVNPRNSDICSRCGSRDLSTPQPKVSVVWRFLEWLVRMALTALLGFFGLVFAYDLLAFLLGTRAVQNALIWLGCLLAVLLWLWSKLPHWFRKFIRRRLRRKKEDRHAEEE